MSLSIEVIVEVFKTNVPQALMARHLSAKLLEQFPGCRINFDLQDSDKILRVEGKQVDPGKITEVLNRNGYQCEVLE